MNWKQKQTNYIKTYVYFKQAILNWLDQLDINVEYGVIPSAEKAYLSWNVVSATECIALFSAIFPKKSGYGRFVHEQTEFDFHEPDSFEKAEEFIRELHEKYIHNHSWYEV